MSNEGFLANLVTVWKRQKRNWKVIVVRQWFDRVFQQLTTQYNSIYIRALGATPIQLGIANSTAGVSGALISAPMGWLQDRYSLRFLFAMGIGLLAVVPLIYAVAWSWVITIPAIMLSALAQHEASCGVVCDVCLENRDRGTAKSICEGLGRIPAIFGPIITAALLTLFGGVNLTGIRPLYIIMFAGEFILFLFVATQLKEIERPHIAANSSGFIRSFREIFESGVMLRRWILLSTINAFTNSMLSAFTYVYAFELKGAQQFILGGIATGSILVQVLFFTPLGTLADRIGRKKVVYVLAPLFYAANLLFVLAFRPELLLLAGVLLGFQSISNVIFNAMTPELVPISFIGRWRGLLGLFGGISSLIAPLVGGYVWTYLGPDYIFYMVIASDLFLRMPLLATMPETLNLKTN